MEREKTRLLRLKRRQAGARSRADMPGSAILANLTTNRASRPEGSRMLESEERHDPTAGRREIGGAWAVVGVMLLLLSLVSVFE